MASSVSIAAVTKTHGCGEGPHWDRHSESLLYVDIHEARIHRYFPATNRHQQLHVARTATGKDVSFVLPVEGHPEVLIIGHGRSIAAVKWSLSDGDEADGDEAEVQSVVLDTVEDGRITRFNDGKCDPRGRIWAGTMGVETSPGVIDMHMGSLYKCGRAQRTTMMLSKVSISNGLEWTEDKKTFYYIDSLTYTVEAFDYDEDSGTIGNRRTVLALRDVGLHTEVPDGMTGDVDGNLWVACFNSCKILHIDPKEKKVLRVVELPAYNITSVCWGGSDYDTLYATSASKALSQQQLQDKPLSGATFQIKGLGTKGFPPVQVKLCEKVRQKINAEFKKN